MTKKIKIVLVLPSLVAGGAERIISFISQNLDSERFNSKLLIAGFEKDNAYNVDNVDVTYLNKKRVLFAVPLIFLFLLKNRPNVVLSSLSHLNVVMAIMSYFFRKTKFIGREATVLSQDDKIKKDSKPTEKKNFFSFGFLYTNMYDKLDAVVCQSQDMAKDMVKNFGVSQSKVKIINNPISSLPPLIENKKNSDIKRFITVGRLSIEKGNLRLIRLLSKLTFDYTYTIIGDGNEKDAVFREAKALGVMDKINHISFTNDVNKYISEHDVFLQGSYVEGFPNAVLESCVVGVPVIAFNVPGGTKEIIKNGINGFLVETEEEYIECLHKNVSWNPKEIRNSVYKKFNKEKIIHEYETMFLDILNKK
jgi:glycosyltransferase involved in cell wall biosynthesis